MENVQILNFFLTEKGISIGKQLGEGASGTVYEIQYFRAAQKYEKQVLKVIDILELAQKSEEDPWNILNRYQREIDLNKMITSCRCEYMVPLLEPYVIKNMDLCICALRMPYYDTLKSLCRSARPDENTVLRLGYHICEALKVLHYDVKDEYCRNKKSRMGVMIHMDIKPSNIFFRKEGENLIFMLGDFGTLSDKGENNILGGTLGYVAPEYLPYFPGYEDKGREDDVMLAENADIFSLGILLYHCLAEEEWEKEIKTEQFWNARCKGETVEKPDNCSQELWKVIEKATSRNTAERYQTAAEMLAALQNVDTKRAELATRENSELSAQNEDLKFAGTVAGILLALDMADKTWKWIKGKFGEKDRICIDGEKVVYEGEVKKGYPHGKGTYLYRWGEEMRFITGKWIWTEEKVVCLGKKAIYRGMKCDGKHSGWARIEMEDTGIFAGTLKNGNFEVGVFQDQSGKVTEALWSDGRIVQEL